MGLVSANNYAINIMTFSTRLMIDIDRLDESIIFVALSEKYSVMRKLPKIRTVVVCVKVWYLHEQELLTSIRPSSRYG